MYQLANEVCQICADNCYNQARETVKVRHPRWLSKKGSVRPSQYETYLDRVDEEYARTNGGPSACCVFFSDEGERLIVCLNHMKQIVKEMEEFDA